MSIYRSQSLMLYLSVDYRTYVTGGGGIGGPYSSVDEAYNYYAMKNPLDIDNGGK